MKFSDTTNKNGIIQRVEWYTRLGDAGITGDSTLLKIVTASVNEAYNKVAMAILTADRNWKWDDNNYGNFPFATQNLVSEQRDYLLPAATVGGDLSTLWRVNKVSVLNTDGVNWSDLTLMGEDEQETTDDTEGSGFPTKYRLHGKSIRLNPKPLTGYVTLTDGLRFEFQRAFDPFTSADTTQEPGFMSAYHDLLALDAAAQYLMPSNTALARDYLALFNDGLDKLKVAYANQNDDAPQKMTGTTPGFRWSGGNRLI